MRKPPPQKAAQKPRNVEAKKPEAAGGKEEMAPGGEEEGAAEQEKVRHARQSRFRRLLPPSHPLLFFRRTRQTRTTLEQRWGCLRKLGTIFAKHFFYPTCVAAGDGGSAHLPERPASSRRRAPVRRPRVRSLYSPLQLQVRAPNIRDARVWVQR